MSSQFEKYFYDVLIECPYGLPYKAVYRQAQFGLLPDQIMEFFLEAGFRRNGNYVYTMACQDCQACVPIRLAAREFKANRNQRRVWRRNQDVKAKIIPLQITSEKLALCDKFLQVRFPGKGNAALEYYAGFFVNGLGQSFEVELWLDDRLVGVSIVDLYANAVNCVYFYFDPDEAKRSLGTFNILYLINYALEHGIEHVYLGYWIKELRAMNYKANFRPHYLYLDGEWR